MHIYSPVAAFIWPFFSDSPNLETDGQNLRKEKAMADISWNFGEDFDDLDAIDLHSSTTDEPYLEFGENLLPPVRAERKKTYARHAAVGCLLGGKKRRLLK